MSTSRFFLPLILIVSILLTSCEKAPDDKEPYSRCQDDPDCEYFRCKVDGKWWTPDCEQGPLFGCTHTDLQYYKDLRGGIIEFTSSSRKNNNGIYIYIISKK